MNSEETTKNLTRWSSIFDGVLQDEDLSQFDFEPGHVPLRLDGRAVNPIPARILLIAVEDLDN